MRLAVFLFSLVATLDFAWGKIYEKCELASDLITRYNVSREEVESLVCIAEFESTFNSGAINHFNWDGSKDFGLFQLNNKYWCGQESGQNVCRTSCKSFLDDDLTDDLRCVQKIIKDTKRWMKVTNGYVAWVAYVNRCQNRDLDEYMSECTLSTTTMSTTSAAPVVTTRKPETTTTTTSRTTSVSPKTQAPIGTSHQKPDQVRGPQIPIYRPIPVRVSKPQTESQTPLESNDASMPPKEPLKNTEGLHKDTLEQTIPQDINPLSLEVVEQLLQILTGAMDQFDLKPMPTPAQTNLMKDVEINFPNKEVIIHPYMHSQAESEVGSNLDNIPQSLHSQTESQVEPNLSNVLDEIILGGIVNTNNPILNLFPELAAVNPITSFYTRFHTKEPIGIPIVKNFPFVFPSGLEQIRSPYLTLNRHNYKIFPLGYPFIGPQGTFSQFQINGYGIYNPYQNFPTRKYFH